MTTAQESTNGHHSSPPPCSVENSPKPSPLDLPADKANSNQNQLATDDQAVQRKPGPFAAGSYHVPPKRFAPRPNAYACDDTFHRPPEIEPLPERCQFMFSDGRQCTMARSDIHPSLCVYHSDREEQLFGDPTYRRETRALDFPELYSACRDLTTAAGVNRALAQVFRLLAQRRISRQEAATFAKLAHLLLRSISLARSESDAAFGDRVGANTPNAVILSESGLADESKDLSASPPVNGAPIQCLPGPSPSSTAGAIEGHVPNASRSQHLKADNSNSRTISTYKNIEDKTAQNQHLQKNGLHGGTQNRPLG